MHNIRPMIFAPLGLVLLSVVVSTSGAECSFQKDVEHIGGDYKHEQVKSQEDCCNLCAAESSCFVAVFWNGYCYMKGEDAGAATPSIGRVSIMKGPGPSPAPPEPPSPTQSCSFQNDVDHIGGDYKHEQVQSQEDCCDVCAAESTCFVAVFWNGYCYMKGEDAGAATPSAGRVSILKGPGPSPTPPQPPSPTPSPSPQPTPVPTPQPTPRPPPGSRCQSGAIAALTQNFIRPAKDAAVDWLLSWLPEQKFSKDVPVEILTVHNFYDITIQDGYDFDFVLQQPTGFKKSSIEFTAKFSLKVNADFSGPLWCSGTLYNTINDVSVDMVLEFGLDSRGLILNVITDSVTVGDVDVDAHGCWYSWIVDVFADILRNGIKSGLKNGIQNAVPKIVDKADKALQTFAYQVPLPFPAPFDNVIFDFHLCNTEVVGTGDTAFLTVGITGDARDSSRPHTTTPVHYAAALPDLTGDLPQHFANVEIGNYSVDTLLYTYFHQGVLSYALQRAALPPGVFRDLLNTNSYKLLIPELYLKYPHQNMTMELNVSGLPETTVEKDELLAHASLDFCFQVDTSAGHIPVFNLTCSGVLAGSVSVNATRGPIAVVGTLKQVTGCAMSEKWSGVGTLGPDVLAHIEDAANVLFESFLIPLANKYLRVDVPTIELKDPNAGKAVYISFLNGTITEESGYALIATNASAVVKSPSLKSSHLDMAQFRTAEGETMYA